MKPRPPLKLHNTMGRKVQDLSPPGSEAIKVYTCGPTVYLEPHIGNWRTFVFYDTLIRTLKVKGYEVDWVLNITDVGHLVSDEDEGEDKLVKTATRERKTAWEVAEHYTDRFLKGLEQLSITTPTHLPKATECIDEQIELIERLASKGYTYEIDDGIYFDTAKLDDYGKLAGEKNTDQLAGASTENNPLKRQPADFALWKFSPTEGRRDMEWDSPFGKGFPGWHLECSAMAAKYLGQTIDIHAGGVDHINVHHTNEIAQSEAAFTKPFADIWLHAEFMLVDDQKMSKSLGNVYILDDIYSRGFSATDLRFRFLQSHYRSQLNFTWESLAAAKAALSNLYMMADRQFPATQLNTGGNGSSSLKERSNDVFEQILAGMENDLNTPAALSHLLGYADFINTHPLPDSEQPQFRAFLEKVDALFALGLSQRRDISTDEAAIIAKRAQARASGDFTQADQLRQQLAKQGVLLNDTAHGTYWYRQS